MPRSVRNFWVDLTVDGRESSIGTGPRSKDGGFYMNIYIREDGDISSNALSIVGTCIGDKLRLFVNDNLFLETKR